MTYSLLSGSAYAKIIQVGSDLDEGFGTLRAAINEACVLDGSDVIHFDPWSPQDDPIVLKANKGSLVIPQDCKGPVTIEGQVGYIGNSSIEVSISGANINTCIIKVYSNGNTLKKLNFINGNSSAVCIYGQNNTVDDVFIGMERLSKNSGGNQKGVYISGNNNTIQDSTIVKGNTDGIDIDGGDSNIIRRNYIGTTKQNHEGAQSSSFKNGGDGIKLRNNASKNIISGAGSLANFIAHNGGNGIEVTGFNSDTNNFAYSVIYGNTGLGVDLNGDGVTENFSCQAAEANDCSLFPEFIESFQLFNDGNSYGHLIKLKVPDDALIVFYQVYNPDPSGYGEGDKPIKFVNVPEKGNLSLYEIQTSIGGNYPPGTVISAMACKNKNGLRECSEFSGNLILNDIPVPDPDPEPDPDPMDPDTNCQPSLQVGGASPHTMGMQWQDDCEGEVGFFYWRKEGNCADVQFDGNEAIAGWIPGELKNQLGEHIDDGLEPSTDYCYVIAAVWPKFINGQWVGWFFSELSPEADGTTLDYPLDEPQNLQADGISTSEIEVTWNDVDGETGYVLYWHPGACAVDDSDENDFVILDDQIPANQTVYIHEGLDEGTTHCYKVKAKDNGGESKFSNKDDGTTLEYEFCPLGDKDNDNICDGQDGGGDPGEGEEENLDTDNDGIPDHDDQDSDNDGIPDVIEAGDDDIETPPVDTDNDGIPDFQDPDSDNDGIPDSEEGLIDTDGDGNPNYTDTDSDDDGILDGENGVPIDNCYIVYNPDQEDTNNNGVGDACELDSDKDGIPDGADNCPLTPNADQADSDGNGIGDLCQDTDGDGIIDINDNCPLTPNTDQIDTDKDGTGDACEALGQEVIAPESLSGSGQVGGCSLGASSVNSNMTWLLALLPFLAMRLRHRK